MDLRKRLLSWFLSLATAATMIVTVPVTASADYYDDDTDVTQSEFSFDAPVLADGVLNSGAIRISDEESAAIKALLESEDAIAGDNDLGAVTASGCSDYFYNSNKLTDAEKTFYGKLNTACQAVLNNPTKDYGSTVVSGETFYPIASVSHTGVDENRAQEILNIFRFSNPQYYFVSNQWLFGSGSITPVFHNGYGYNFALASDREIAKNALDALTNAWMPEIDAASGDLAKETVINSKITAYLTYDDAGTGSDDHGDFDQLLISGVLNKTTVCTGYAMMTAYFCNKAGIDSFVVTSSNHAWNFVNLFGNWYELDNTWNDSYGSGGYIWVNKSRQTLLNQDKTTNTEETKIAHTLESVWSGILPATTRDEVYIPSTNVAIDSNNFPDAVFRTYVLDNFDTMGSDGILNTTELEAVTAIDVHEFGITNLKGIEHFSKLETLIANKNNISTVDVSKNTELKELNLSNNNLQALNVKQNKKLETLQVDFNSRLTALDVTENIQLSELNCANCKLSAVNVSKNTKLTKLSCGSNYNVTKLDVSACELLTELYCQNNKIATLDLTHNEELVKVQCNNNLLQTLYVTTCEDLVDLFCSDNKLPALDVSNNVALEKFECHNNLLTSLNVKNNTLLTDLRFDGNKIVSIDLSDNDDLETLYCGNNQLTSLDVSNCGDLTLLSCPNNKIKKLDVSNNTALNTLYCQNNALAYVDLTANTGLTRYDLSGNVYDAGNIIDTLDVATIDGFEPNNMSDPVGADYDDVNDCFKNFTSNPFSYKYECAAGIIETFKISFGKVKRLDIEQKPAKLAYIYGDQFKVDGGKLKVTFDNGQVKTIDMTYSMISGYNPLKVGTQTITVTFGGLSKTFTVTVGALVVDTIVIDDPTELVTSFYLDGDFTVGDAQAKVTYNNGVTETIRLDNTAKITVDSSKFNNQKIGTYIITVKCGNKSLTYPVDVTVDPTIATLSLTSSEGTFYYNTMADAFAKITSIKKSTEDYTITLYKDTATEKALNFPAYAKSITISGAKKLNTTVTSIAPKCSLTLNVNIVHVGSNGNPNHKAIGVKMPANATLTIAKDFDDLGAITGAATSALLVEDDVTAASVATFGTVEIVDDKTLFVTGKMTGIGHLDGRVYLTDAVSGAATITNAGDATVTLRQTDTPKKSIAKLTVTDVDSGKKLTVEVRDSNEILVAVPSGTPLITAADTKKDFTKRVKFANGTEDGTTSTKSGNDLTAFVYGKEVRAEFADLLELDGENYPNFEQAFKHVTATGENIIFVNDTVEVSKLVLPTKIDKLTIKGKLDGGRKTIKLDKITSLAPSFSLTLDNIYLSVGNANSFAINGKKDITLKDTVIALPANSKPASITATGNITLYDFSSSSEDTAVKVGGNLMVNGNDATYLGTVTGTKNSTFEVAVTTCVSGISTFGKIVITSSMGIVSKGKVSGVGLLYGGGQLWMKSVDKSATATITTVQDATLALTLDGGAIAKATVNDVVGELHIRIVDKDNKLVKLESGTPILTAGGNVDFTGRIVVDNENKNPVGGDFELSAYLYKKEIRAEYGRVLSVTGGEIDRDFPNFETAVKAIDDNEAARKKAALNPADYTITVYCDTAPEKLVLPKTAKSLKIKSYNEAKTINLKGTTSLTAKYDLILQNIKINNVNAKNEPTAITINQNEGLLYIESLEFNAMPTLKGSTKSELKIVNKCSDIQAISGFGTVEVWIVSTNPLKVGKSFSFNKLIIATGCGIYVPSGCTFSAKDIEGDSDSFISLENGFKPITISGTAKGTIALKGDKVTTTTQIFNSAKMCLGVFDVSAIQPAAGDYALTRESSKVYCRPNATLELDGKKFVKFADVVNDIENDGVNDGDYTITLTTDYANGAALKFPKAGTFKSIEINTNGYDFTFTGNVTLTGNTAIGGNGKFYAVDRNGNPAKYTLTSAKNLPFTAEDIDLGKVSSVGLATSDITLDTVKFDSNQSVQIKANKFIFEDVTGVFDAMTVNSLEAVGNQDLFILEKKTITVKEGFTAGSEDVEVTVVKNGGTPATTIANKAVLFTKLSAADFAKVSIGNAGYKLERDTKTGKVTIVKL